MKKGIKQQSEEFVNESELLERVRNSDVDAFRVLFERYQPVVFRQVLYQTRDAELAHDIVQETFLRIWEHRVSLKPHFSFLAYAIRVSGNLVRDSIKHRDVRRKLEEHIPPPIPSEGDNPEEVFHRAILEQNLIDAVNSDLPEKCRLIFLLSRMEGQSNQEIADLLGVAKKTVENQLNHALKILRRKLKEHLS